MSKQESVALDGNSAAGLLSELFALEITDAKITCDGCEATAPIGAMRLYGGRMGAIFRCVHCDNVVVRLVRTADGYWLEMKGTRSLFVQARGE
jgi:hypothetical protein